MFNTYVFILFGANFAYIFAAVFVQDFYWRDYIPGTIPFDALQVDDRRYIGQVNHMGNFVPATIYSHTNIAIAEMGGVQVLTSNIKILCTPDTSRFYWEYVDFTKPHDMQMNNAVKGGSQWNYDLFVGKTFHEGELKIGKVIPMDQTEWKGLYVWDKDRKSMMLTSFDILKYNATIVSGDGRIIFKM